MTRADLLAAGWKPMLPQHYLENPLRTYLVIPVRTVTGVWFGTPLFYGLHADLELIREAEAVARTRYRQKIS